MIISGGLKYLTEEISCRKNNLHHLTPRLNPVRTQLTMYTQIHTYRVVCQYDQLQTVLLVNIFALSNIVSSSCIHPTDDTATRD